MLGSFISPKTGLVLIRKQIEKAINKPAPNYSIYYSVQKDELNFIIEKLVVKYDSDMLKTAIMSVAKKSAKNNQEITAVKISINETDEVSAELFFIENGEKKKVTQNL